MGPAAGLALAAVLALAACTAPAPSVAPSAAVAGPVLQPIDVSPAERAEAGIAAAFHPAQAQDLVAEVPVDIDFGRHALVCVYLGERPTTGWGLDLQSASVLDGELRIRARETRPPASGARPRISYPAGCGLLERAALPEGELAVRADDTISEEFIVDGTLSVPPASDAP